MEADTLNQNNIGRLNHLMVSEWDLYKAMQWVEIREQYLKKYVASLQVQLTLIQRIREGQMTYAGLQSIRGGVEHEIAIEFSVCEDGVLKFRAKCVFLMMRNCERKYSRRLIHTINHTYRKY